MAQNDDDDDGPPGVRKYCTLSPVTIRRLKVLAKRATHGTSVPKIMTHFIEAGIRDAIDRNYINIEDGEEPSRSKAKKP